MVWTYAVGYMIRAVVSIPTARAGIEITGLDLSPQIAAIVPKLIEQVLTEILGERRPLTGEQIAEIDRLMG